jgi:hypothetical protein
MTPLSNMAAIIFSQQPGIQAAPDIIVWAISTTRVVLTSA